MIFTTAQIPVFYSSDYVGASHDFDTTRKAKWVADSLIERPIAGIVLKEPVPLTKKQLARVHEEAYIQAVETGTPASLASSQSFSWDPELWKMVLASNGGAVAAALAALKTGMAGSLSSGLHHAQYDTGSGFCTFNGLAIAAEEALAAGARSILIIDLDAHCGGGTHSLIQNRSAIWQLDVSVCTFDRYRQSPRCSLDVVIDANEYLPTIDSRLDALDQNQDAPKFDLCIYNAGMDPYEHSDIGRLNGITSEILEAREKLIFRWCKNRKIPIAFVLAGGYVGNALNQEQLVNLHRLTFHAASSCLPDF